MCFVDFCDFGLAIVNTFQQKSKVNGTTSDVGEIPQCQCPVYETDRVRSTHWRKLEAVLEEIFKLFWFIYSCMNCMKCCCRTIATSIIPPYAIVRLKLEFRQNQPQIQQTNEATRWWNSGSYFLILNEKAIHV